MADRVLSESSSGGEALLFATTASLIMMTVVIAGAVVAYVLDKKRKAVPPYVLECVNAAVGGIFLAMCLYHILPEVARELHDLEVGKNGYQLLLLTTNRLPIRPQGTCYSKIC